MKIIIDPKECLKHKLSLPEVFITLALKETNSYVDTFEDLVKRGILEYKNNKYHVAPAWETIIDEILLESSGGIYSDERLSNLATELRNCFPAGKQPGTPYYFRCNNREVMIKLKAFFEKYGNYPDEKILEAARKFVAAHNGNYRYLPLVKYFISKQKLELNEDGTKHTVEVSTLASYLEGKEDEINTDNWLMTIRN